MGGQSIDDYVIANYESHGVYQDADDDQAGSTKMMIYYEKKRKFWE